MNINDPVCHASCIQSLKKSQAELAEANKKIAQKREDGPVFCAYCSFEIPSPVGIEVLTAHVLVCEFHPMRKVQAELADWKDRAYEAQHLSVVGQSTIKDLRKSLDYADLLFNEIEELVLYPQILKVFPMDMRLSIEDWREKRKALSRLDKVGP